MRVEDKQSKMTVIAVLLVCLAVKVVYSANVDCQNPVHCPCGRKGYTVKVCPTANGDSADVCAGLSRCESCEEGLNTCTRCPAGQEGPFCFQGESHCNLVVQGSGYVNCTKDVVGTHCDVHCHDSPAVRFNCYPGRPWDPPLPRCVKQTDVVEVMCADPGQVANAERLHLDGSSSSDVRRYRVGESVMYLCQSGFALLRRSLITCLASGTWSFPIPACTRITTPPIRTNTKGMRYCGDPGVYPNGSRRPRRPPALRGFPQGSRLEYSCDRGYDLVGEQNIFCLTSGEWSATRPRCIAQSGTPDTSQVTACKDPGDIVNGKVAQVPPIRGNRRREYPVGTELQYSCDDGYILEGSSNIICENTGSWSAMRPTCTNDGTIRIQFCDNPGPILYGRMRYIPPNTKLINESEQALSLDYDLEAYTVRSVLEYSCDEGYWLQGSESLTCQSTGFWSAEVPSCVEECGRFFTFGGPNPSNSQQTDGQWPWIVSISVQNKKNTTFICLGALVSPHTVITAAHCLLDVHEPGSAFVLNFGRHSLPNNDGDTEMPTRKSYQIHLHPDYSNVTQDSDIGLLVFIPKVMYSKRVMPICLPSSKSTDMVTGQSGYVKSWVSSEDFTMRISSRLLPVVSNETCQNFYRNNRTVTNNMFCTEYTDGCGMDSGSPFIVYDTKEQRYTLEGMVSFGMSGLCGVTGRYISFTKISRFLPWILRHLK